MKLNESSYITTLGITIYCYEGIGIIMPVMAACEKPERFKEQIIYVFLTLVSFYLIFAETCYFAWGSDLTEPLVTQMLPADSLLVIILKFLFSLNLVCSFPIMINPANAALENWFCKCFKHNKTKLYWSQNFSRFLIVVLEITISVCLASKIDKFVGLVGSVLCVPLALFLPALLHLNAIAKTPM